MPLVNGEPIEEGTFLVVLEPGMLLGDDRDDDSDDDDDTLSGVV